MASSHTSRLGTAPEEAIKAPCVVAALTPITLTGEQTIDGLPVVSGQRVLVAGQLDPVENGIYVCFTGAWERATDWNANDDVVNGMLVVETHRSEIYQASFVGSFNLNLTEVTFTSYTDVIVAEIIAGGTDLVTKTELASSAGTVLINGGSF